MSDDSRDVSRAATPHGFMALSAGTRLDGRYTIQSVIGAGGFGITYVATHDGLGRTYAIKEHFPRQFAYRDGTTSEVRPTDPKTFSWALDRFLQEGRSLATCKHPNIVDVTDVFEGNGTAYMVLVYEAGHSLADWLKALGRAPTQGECDEVLAPLLDALAFVHDQGLLHRDIAPDNIMIRSDGKPCLIDFGAARQAIAQRSQLMSAIVKTGYSPPEQYTTSGKAQGPWSDIYALAATVYRMVTGEVPPEATERQDEDELRPVAGVVPSPQSYRESFLAGIDAGLRLRRDERPQSVEAWRGMLLRGRAASGPPPIPEAMPVSGLHLKALKPDPIRQPPLVYEIARPPEPAESNRKVTYSELPADGGRRIVAKQPRGSGGLKAVAATVIVLALGGAGWWMIEQRVLPAVDPAVTKAEADRRRDPVAALAPGSGQNARDRLADGRDCPTCPEMVVVPKGSFRMGSPDSEASRGSDEGPVRTVTIGQPFAIARYEVTFAEWDACRADGGCNHNPGDEGWGRGNRSVINVSWSDAQEYAAWLSRRTGKSYRLLSEAEWEYAARAGTTTRFSFGDADSGHGEHAWFSGNSSSRTQAVGGKRANAWGLHDMHGNVWEWVQDCWINSYQGAPTDGSARTTGDCSSRVLRGGSWHSDPRNLRSAVRHWDRPGRRDSGVGFRVARSVSR